MQAFCMAEVNCSDLHETTVPTTMVVALITWSLRSGHVPKDTRAAAWRFLDNVLRQCTRTQKFKLVLRPEYVRGSRLNYIHVFYLLSM